MTNIMEIGSMVTQPQLTFEEAYPDSMIAGSESDVEDRHKKLLDYVNQRLMSQVVHRSARLTRYARIDKQVSTWQVLTEEDTQRAVTQEHTGKAQAMSMNLPLIHTHLDDMVSFFAGVYAPASGDFFQMGEPQVQDIAKPLVAKLNADAKRTKAYKELCLAIRGLLKYNIGGFRVRWAASEVDDVSEVDEAGATTAYNKMESLDMYNFMWDNDIADPANIRKDAEWAALAMLKTPRWLATMEKNGTFKGCYCFLDKDASLGNNGRQAMYYRYPPQHAGLSSNDQKTVKGSQVNWQSYGAGLSGDATIQITGHEVVELFIWINPGDFGLIDNGKTFDTKADEGYYLWKLYIVNGTRIVYCKPVPLADQTIEDKVGQDTLEIPYFLGYLNQDDMGDAQRSTAELLAPFQSFGSFLLNIHVAGMRSNIWGIQVYDPSVIDMGKMNPGSTTARIPSKVPGRDVRSALTTVNGEVDTSKTMETLQSVLAMMKEFFPAQALPSQVAGIDRAVTSQVSAVLQGVNRRLHMMVRVLDDDILGPTRWTLVNNVLVGKAVQQVTGLNNEVIQRVVSNGLAQLNREAAAQAMQQLLFAIIQNPQSASQIDVLGLMNYWSGLMNIQADLKDFAIQQPAPQVGPDGQPITPGAAPTPPAPGGAQQQGQ